MSCPANPPAPSGFKVWQGPVPAPLTAWAITLRDHIAGPAYGTTWTTEYNGQVVLARKDRHSWTFRGGQLVTDICIPGVTLYSPKPMGLAEGLNAGDPLATPNATFALFDAANAPLPPVTTDWGLVAVSGSAAAAVVVLFLWGLHAAGRPT